MKATTKKKAKKVKRAPVKPISIKVADEWHDAVHKKALRHARGNLSAWIRHASRMYVPKEGERINLRAS